MATTSLHANNTTNTTNITNNTTNNTTNKITVVNFGMEDMSFLAHEIVVNLAKQEDLGKSVQELIKLIHFNPEHPENLNVYLPSKDSSHGYSANVGQWLRRGTNDLANLVISHATGLMNDQMPDRMSDDSDTEDPNEGEFSEFEIRRFDDYCKSMDAPSVLKPIIDDAINTMYQHKHMVERANLKTPPPRHHDPA